MIRAILLLKLNSLKAQLEYPANFFTLMISISLIGFLQIPALLIMLNAFGSIGGWDFPKLGFMAALVLISEGLYSALFFSFYEHLTMVKEGHFDRLLVRPLHPLLQIMASSLEVSAIGGFLPGMVLLAITAPQVKVAWNLLNLLFLILVVFSAAIIFFSMNLFFTAFDFWFGQAEMLWIPSAFAHPGYPTHIYGPVLAFILTFIFPYAFIAYYPAHHFFKIPVQGFPGFFAYLTPVVAVLTLAVAVAFWSFSLRRYQSSGR